MSLGTARPSGALRVVAPDAVADVRAWWADPRRPAVAASIVKPFVSTANHWLVKHHGIFQGYFFWRHIALDRNARDTYRGSGWFEYIEEFCAKYDQVAFDADYRSEPLEHFEPLVRARLVKSVAAP